jgi:hypothetical protein
MAMSTYLKNQRSEINNLQIYLKALEKQGQPKLID